MKFLKFLLFNRFVKSFLTFDFGGKENKAPDRIKAFMIEGLYVSMIFMPIIMALIIVARGLELMIIGDYDYTRPTIASLVTVVPLCSMGIFFLNKDFFNGRSIVNRVWGFQVLDIKTLQPPSKFKCLLRNITGSIFPLELLFILFNHERRLGDYIAGTRLIKVEPSDPEIILNEIRDYSYDGQSRLVLIFPVIVFTIWAIWAWTV